jgi:ubiquitin C-terminal hydrolase
MNFDSYKDKGLTGLANLGNTCYLNSCIQIFSHTYELNELFKKISQERNLNNVQDSLLLVEWNKLLTLMWSKNCTVAPYGFVKGIQTVSKEKGMELFTGFAQNDMPEFLFFLIDCFHNGLEREVNIKITGVPQNSNDKIAKVCYKMMQDMYSKHYSELLNIFYGIQVSKITNTSREVRAITGEPFSLLNLPIPNNQEIKNPSIYDCFDLYCKEELLQGDNAWYNEELKIKEDILKGLCFWTLPDILIMDLKRFTFNNKKIHTIVSIDVDKVDLSKYVIGYNKDKCLYQVYAICNHEGSCLGGHYYAYIRTANNKWYKFNDTEVREIPEKQLISDKCYCFFLRKIK